MRGTHIAVPGLRTGGRLNSAIHTISFVAHVGHVGCVRLVRHYSTACVRADQHGRWASRALSGCGVATDRCVATTDWHAGSTVATASRHSIGADPLRLPSSSKPFPK